MTTKWAFKWVCYQCWRKGTVVVEANSKRMAAESAEADHAREVEIDLKAQKVPAGLPPISLHAIAITGTACTGQLTIGEPKRKLTWLAT